QEGFQQYRPAAIPRRKILQADVRAVPARNGRSTIESGSEEIVGVEPVRLCLKNACALYSVRSPPPCGEGWGVVPLLRRWRHHHLTASPPPQPSPTRGEGADRVRCSHWRPTPFTGGQSMTRKELAVVVALAAAVVADTACAQFYKGKTVTMIINYPAGGPTDIEGRIVAQHLPAHIAGKPTIVIKNVGGAGGVIGTNQLAEAAPNGETIGFFTIDVVAQLLG